MDDERFKQTEKWDYLDEWIARIRDISHSTRFFKRYHLCHRRRLTTKSYPFEFGDGGD